MERFSNINYDIESIINTYKSTNSGVNYSRKKVENYQNSEIESTYFVESEINQNIIVEEYRPAFSFFYASAILKQQTANINLYPIKPIELNSYSEPQLNVFEQCVSDEEDEAVSAEKYHSLEKKYYEALDKCDEMKESIDDITFYNSKLRKENNELKQQLSNKNRIIENLETKLEIAEQSLVNQNFVIKENNELRHEKKSFSNIIKQYQNAEQMLQINKEQMAIMSAQIRELQLKNNTLEELINSMMDEKKS